MYVNALPANLVDDFRSRPNQGLVRLSRKASVRCQEGAGGGYVAHRFAVSRGLGGSAWLGGGCTRSGGDRQAAGEIRPIRVRACAIGGVPATEPRDSPQRAAPRAMDSFGRGRYRARLGGGGRGRLGHDPRPLPPFASRGGSDSGRIRRSAASVQGLRPRNPRGADRQGGAMLPDRDIRIAALKACLRVLARGHARDRAASGEHGPAQTQACPTERAFPGSLPGAMTAASSRSRPRR
jgi:hypothetical protein